MAWAVSGNIKGPQGDQGIQGIPGEDGAGVAIAGSVATYGDLPTTLGAADSGDGYLVSADGKLYVWDGSAFPPDGSGAAFRGPPGPDGVSPTVAVGTVTTGAAGSNAGVTNSGSSAAAVFNFTIPKGDQGNTGTAGADGAQWFTGTGAPGTVPGSTAGDHYLDVASGDVYALS